MSAHPFRRVALHGHTDRLCAAPELRCLLSPPAPPSWTSPVNQGRGQFDALEAEEEAEEAGEEEGGGGEEEEEEEEVTGLRAGLMVGEGERSIFTSLSRCVCAQRGRRALRVQPSSPATTSSIIPEPCPALTNGRLREEERSRGGGEGGVGCM